MASSPKTTFLDLPREIRDMIYYHSLHADERIMVIPLDSRRYKKPYCCELRSLNPTPLVYAAIFRANGYDAARLPVCSLHRLAVGLLQCRNRLVAREAAAMFYKSNTFGFGTYYSWEALHAFLQMIGEDNRGQLRRLHICTYRPGELIPRNDGAHERLPPSWCRSKALTVDVAPESHDPSSNDDNEPRRVPHYCRAVEACFRLLGKTGPRMVLTLPLSDFSIPSILNEEYQNTRCLKAAPIGVTERFMMKYMSEPGKAPRADLLWFFPVRDKDLEACKRRFAGIDLALIDIKILKRNGNRRRVWLLTVLKAWIPKLAALSSSPSSNRQLKD